MDQTILQRLYSEQYQAPWLDNISRGMINSGTLQQLIAAGIVGVTSNPTIFEKAITGGSDYDAQIRLLAGQDQPSDQLLPALMLWDVADAADMLREVYERTNHLDGYVSIEVTPDVAYDSALSITQARHFQQQLQRPNIFVKIPATAQGIVAIEQAIYEGININITLIFSLERYRQVVEAYMSGLERRLAEGKPLAGIRSVASFFVSRVDTNVDARLDQLIAATVEQERRDQLAALKGQAAIANARLAYEVFQQQFATARWQRLAAGGASLQRPLWASTSTKNPAYPDLLYVEALIGPNTVNTMPNATIAAFNDHGRVARTVDQDRAAARQLFDELAGVGILMSAVTSELEDEGIATFVRSYAALNEALAARQRDLQRAGEQLAATH